MKLPLIALSVVLLVLPVAAQTPVETVEVSGNALVGLWKMQFPSFGSVNPFGRVSWGALQNTYCRFEQATDGLTANCFSYPRGGSVSIEGAHFHMAWGTMMARGYMDGTMTSPLSFDGHNGVKFAGMGAENPIVAHGQKIALSEIPPDTSGGATILTKLQKLLNPL